jgi:hypothetical protein
MEHTVSAPIYRGEDTYPRRPVFLITLTPAMLPAWCLNLMLLYAQHINAVTVIDPEDGFRLHLMVQLESHHDFIEWGAEPELHMAHAPCWHLLNFGLKYYRDGFGPIHETDFELYHVDHEDVVARLIIRAADAPPERSHAEVAAEMAEYEAELRRLGKISD